MKKIVSILSVIAMLLTVGALFSLTVSAASIPAFSSGSITETANGNTIDTDDFSVFASSKTTGWGSKCDLRFVLAADLQALATYAKSELYLDITFVDADGAFVKSLRKSVFKDLVLYASVTAAGNTYTAAEGVVLFGAVITDAPGDAWATATVTLLTDEIVAQGKVTSEISEIEGINLSPGSLGGNAQVTAMHGHYGYLVLDVAMGGYYPDIVPVADITDAWNWSNPKYQWVLRVNGREFTPERLSVWNMDGNWGQVRAELGSVYEYEMINNTIEFTIELKIIEVATGKTKYYADFVQHVGAPLIYTHYPSLPDSNMPEDLSVVKKVELVSGPNGYGGNIYESAIHTTTGTMLDKLCTMDKDPIIYKLPETTTLQGLSIVNCQGNSYNPERTLLDFDVYVSADGENWGEPVLVASSAGKDRPAYSQDLTETWYAFSEAAEATYVKIVPHHTEGIAYQLTEVLFYQ